MPNRKAERKQYHVSTKKDGIQSAKEEIAKEGYTTIQLCQSIGSFADDPPDSAFQKGYLQGLFDELQERLAQ